MKRVGEFEIRSGRIAISDPCYGGDKEFPAENGTWIGLIEMSDEGSWGMRVKRLVAHHMGYGVESRRDYGDSVGVDSGQMSIVDAEICPALADNLYDVVCQVTCPAGIVAAGTGVASSTGYGDGGYALKLAKVAGKVVAAEVVFIPDPQKCSECGEEFVAQEEDIELCDTCYVDVHGSDCENCGDRFHEDDMRDGLCEDCYEEWLKTHECLTCGCVCENEVEDGECEHCRAEHKVSG